MYKRNFTTAPNQKVITVNKVPPKNNFLQISNSAWQSAARELTPTGFKLYLYFMSNAPNYSFALSSVDVVKTLGVSDKSYRTAVNELIDKKYLNLIKGNVYSAVDSPADYPVKVTGMSEVDSNSLDDNPVKVTGYPGKIFLDTRQNLPDIPVKVTGEIDNRYKDKIDTKQSIKPEEESDPFEWAAEQERNKVQVAREDDMIDKIMSREDEVTKDLLAKGFTQEHIDNMLKGKPAAEMVKHNYGIMFSKSYQAQHKPAPIREVKPGELGRPATKELRSNIVVPQEYVAQRSKEPKLIDMSDL